MRWRASSRTMPASRGSSGAVHDQPRPRGGHRHAACRRATPLAAQLPSPPRWRAMDGSDSPAVVLAGGRPRLSPAPTAARGSGAAFRRSSSLYVGFINGDLLAQSLFAGWMQAGAPWRTAPGLVLLAAAALAVPWATGRTALLPATLPARRRAGVARTGRSETLADHASARLRRRSALAPAMLLALGASRSSILVLPL